MKDIFELPFSLAGCDFSKNWSNYLHFIEIWVYKLLLIVLYRVKIFSKNGVIFGVKKIGVIFGVNKTGDTFEVNTKRVIFGVDKNAVIFGIIKNAVIFGVDENGVIFETVEKFVIFYLTLGIPRYRQLQRYCNPSII